jgi:prolyl oligopeptidase
LWVVDIEKHGIKADLPWIKLVNEWGADYGVFANDGTKQYLTTNKVRSVALVLVR